jgi:hypothetical protein
MASGVQISGMEEWHVHEIFSLPLSLSGCLSLCKTMEDQQKLIGIYHHITATICLFSVETGLLIHVQQVLSLDFAVADTDMLRKNLTLNSDSFDHNCRPSNCFEL